MLLIDIRDALLTVTNKVYHFDATGAKGNYIVWAEEGQTSATWADNKMQEQAIGGTIDYFTKFEFDENVDKIQKALNDAEISFELNSIQHEEQTKYIHYEWTWDIPNESDSTYLSV